MLYMVTFLCIVTMLISISIGFALLKSYALIKYHIKREEDFTYLHSKLKELEDGGTQPVQNNTTLNRKYDLPIPKITSDNKIYSQDEFYKEINNGNFQMSPMLQSKLYEKNKKTPNP